MIMNGKVFCKQRGLVFTDKAKTLHLLRNIS